MVNACLFSWLGFGVSLVEHPGVLWLARERSSVSPRANVMPRAVAKPASLV